MLLDKDAEQLKMMNDNNGILIHVSIAVDYVH